METIIHIFLKESIDLIKKSLGKAIEDGFDISELVGLVKDATDELGRNILKTVLEEVDEQLLASPVRKKNWNIHSRKDVKNFLTKLGMINYERTYFFNKDKQKYKYLVDEMFGIEVHDRMDAAMEAELIKLSSEMSYRKSGKIASSEEISGQTVMNKIREQESIKVEKVADTKKEIEVLYIEADEDHIALQNGNPAQAKLIYIHEGLEHQGKRNSLKNCFYISSVLSNTNSIWEEAWEYVRNNYNTDKIKRIYLQGDGAHWIKQGLSYLPNAKFVLDRFHMNKYITKATAQNRVYAPYIWNCLNMANKDKFIKTIEDLIKETIDGKKIEEIKECKKYLLNNWKGIEIQAYEDKMMIGCSAEGHVSHLLSARMSSRPLGWSLAGADDMARLRVFIKNGGNVLEMIKLEKSEKPCKLVTKKLLTEARKRITRKFNEGVNNIEVIRQGKKTELFDELKRIRFKAI